MIIGIETLSMTMFSNRKSDAKLKEEFGPSLDPWAIGGASQNTVLHFHAHHIVLALLPSEAADADAVARDAMNVGDHHIATARSNGDAIAVASAYSAMGDVNVSRVSNVDPFGVKILRDFILMFM